RTFLILVCETTNLFFPGRPSTDCHPQVAMHKYVSPSPEGCDGKPFPNVEKHRLLGYVIKSSSAPKGAQRDSAGTQIAPCPDHSQVHHRRAPSTWRAHCSRRRRAQRHNVRKYLSLLFKKKKKR
uniref:Uncharacterized protein n=1 Tax=Apteryx owenii TaxID=8824 RepID=A0A8B9PZ90_APTOW